MQISRFAEECFRKVSWTCWLGRLLHITHAYFKISFLKICGSSIATLQRKKNKNLAIKQANKWLESHIMLSNKKYYWFGRTENNWRKRSPNGKLTPPAFTTEKLRNRQTKCYWKRLRWIDSALNVLCWCFSWVSCPRLCLPICHMYY